MEEGLIEAVRREKCLYDVKHPNYVKTKFKDSIWGRIAMALNIKDGNEAKKTWEKLRNNHRDALRRQKKLQPKSVSEPANTKSWRFQNHMAFLIPYMANRLNTTNVHEEMQIDEPSQAQPDNREVDSQEYLVEQQELQTNNEDSNQSSEASPTNWSQIPTGQLHKKKRLKGNTLDELLNRSIEEHQERVDKRQRERERLASNTTNYFNMNDVKNDPLFHFFISMYQSTKILPPISQLTIKTDLFASVSREESKHLIQNSPRPQSSQSHVSETGSYSSNTPAQLNKSLSNTQTAQAHEEIISEDIQEFDIVKVEDSNNDFVYSTEPY